MFFFHFSNLPLDISFFAQFLHNASAFDASHHESVYFQSSQEETVCHSNAVKKSEGKPCQAVDAAYLERILRERSQYVKGGE